MVPTTNNLDSPAELLRTAYSQLAFDQGALLSAMRQPQPGALGEWLDRGDWQSLAAQVGAERIFFVDRDPVVVFAQAEDSSGEVLRKLYERIWCMSRPQLLFLASPGQLAVYDLTKPPPKPDETLDGHDRLIAIARSIAQVQSELAAYHRERIETGAVFGEDRFRDSANRADRALIRDLKTVREQLAMLSVPRGQKHAELHHLHSLIGRAIFVRYLEDREILVPEYFQNVANRRQAWQKLLAQAPSAPALEPGMADLRFLRVLQNKEFTYALFNQLADDFNGDTFPIEEGERDCIQQEHLDKLRGFLLGSTSEQQDLFFFAYRFNVIPIELISTIYEEFYNERIGKDRNQGSHYTPPALVEFVLAHTLTPEVLATKPRVFDPACGSGIFLVESFRRIVRHLWGEQNGKRVSRPQLRKILREQIAGMDINEEAVRVAAFSLYLAFLHYQEPREINAERRLPYLKWVSEEERNRREKQKPGAQFFDVLLHANAFEAISGTGPAEVTRRFGPGSATVVVGNPPWGYPKKEDKESQNALAQTLKWCDAKNGRPVGDKELSQAFIHLTLALLQDGGRAGLLVSSGIFFKHHANSRKFRRVWLTAARLEHIVNFAHVRQIFFSGPQREAQGISPFASVVFERTMAGPPPDSRFQYWSAKRTATIENTKCIVLNRGDMHWLSQRDCLADERLWKIYWWGGHRDEVTIRSINRFSTLENLHEIVPTAATSPGQGFKVANKSVPAGWLKGYRELPAESLRRYGPFDKRVLRDVPDMVERRGVEDVYHGHRLLVGRGIKAGGSITARLETRKYAFRNSIHGVRLKGLEPWQEATLIGIFWSSLARYFYFTTSGSWGFWHDELHLKDIEQMPICFPQDAKLRDRIVQVVTKLQELELPPAGMELFHGTAASDLQAPLELELDEAIFDLYELTAAERDLIRDRCSIGLDLFYQHHKGTALQEVSPPARSFGMLSDLSHTENGLSAYLRTFLEIWNDELAPDGEFAWRVLSPPSRAPLLAVCFTTRHKKDQRPIPSPEHDPAASWSGVLAHLQQHSLVHAETSRIFIDTFFRYVSDREILFIKRNEGRFWTRTAAREDAESALTHLMNLEEDVPGDGQ
jgi:type I restriction-modification system DNA methylase subunit